MAETTHDDRFEAKEAHAGKAQRVDSSAVMARAESVSFLPQQALDARQEAIGTQRRRGGPSFDEMSEDDLPDVETPGGAAPTECDDPYED